MSANFLESPIFLCGAPRSGTTLLHDLFDGVHGVVSIPIENHASDKFLEFKEFGNSSLLDYFH